MSDFDDLEIRIKANLDDSEVTKGVEAIERALNSIGDKSNGKSALKNDNEEAAS